MGIGRRGAVRIALPLAMLLVLPCFFLLSVHYPHAAEVELANDTSANVRAPFPPGGASGRRQRREVARLSPTPTTTTAVIASPGAAAAPPAPPAPLSLGVDTQQSARQTAAEQPEQAVEDQAAWEGKGKKVSPHRLRSAGYDVYVPPAVYRRPTQQLPAAREPSYVTPGPYDEQQAAQETRGKALSQETNGKALVPGVLQTAGYDVDVPSVVQRLPTQPLVRRARKTRKAPTGGEPQVAHGEQQAVRRVPAPPPPPAAGLVPQTRQPPGVGLGDEDSANAGGRSGHRGLFALRPPARVMVLVLSSGNGSEAVARRAAVLETWYGDGVYFVTHEPVAVPRERVVWLPDAAETITLKTLPVKVNAMWAHVYEHFRDQFDWFMKVDHDTFVNLPRLRRTLSAFDPEVPALLGNPFAGKVTPPVAGPNAFWQRFKIAPFCHGGAGYILSRALLRQSGPHFRSAPFYSSNEDTTVGAVLLAATGARCLHYSGDTLGGLDLVANSHNQTEITNVVKRLAQTQPDHLLAAVTVHSVTGATARLIFQEQEALRTAEREASVDLGAERELEVRRRLLAPAWSCPAAGDRHAVCIASALYDPPLLSPAVSESMLASWEASDWSGVGGAVDREAACRALRSGGNSAVRAWFRSQQPSAAGGEGRMGRREGQEREQARPALPVALNTTHEEAADEGAHDAVLVVLGDGTDAGPSAAGESGLEGATTAAAAELRALGLLARSLRATGEAARLVVFHPQGSERMARVRAALNGWGCATTLVAYNLAMVLASTAPTPEAAAALTASVRLGGGLPPLAAMGLLQSFLQRDGWRFRRVLVVPPDAVFQRAPFTALAGGPSLVVFAADPVEEPPEPPTSFGEPCRREAHASNERHLRLNTELALGQPKALVGLYSAIVASSNARRGCSVGELLRMAVYRRDVARLWPLAVVGPWSGLVAQLGPAVPGAVARMARVTETDSESEGEGKSEGDGESDKDSTLLVVNGVDEVAAVVVAWRTMPDARITEGVEENVHVALPAEEVDKRTAESFAMPTAEARDANAA